MQRRSPLRATTLALALALAVSLAGCSDQVLSPDKADAPELLVSEVIPTVVTLSWSTIDPVVGYIEYGQDGAFDQSTPTDTPADRDHRITVLGLKAGGTYDLRSVSIASDGTETVSETVTVTLEPPPPALAPLTVSEYDRDRAAPGGFVLTSVITTEGTWTTILDRDGDAVWYWQVDEGLSAYGARFDETSRSVYFLQVDQQGKADTAGLLQVALDGSETTFTRTNMGHHDAVRLPDGTVSWLSYDFRTTDVEGDTLFTVSDAILELPEGQDQEAPDNRFSVFNLRPAYIHCEHFWEELFDTGAVDYSHANSIMYDADRDVYRLMNRNLDALMIIDRATGDVLHEIGGEYADIATEDPADMWSHGHMSHAWEGGFMVFDNGDHHEPKISRVSEYALDEEAGTLERVWSWSDPDELFIPFFGDAQKLTDTYFTAWTSSGRLQEVTPDGEIVWRAETDLGMAIGRSIWTDDLYDLSDAQTF